MSNAHGSRFVVPALILALGLAGGAYFLADGIKQFRSADRYVSVKGLSERIVPADLVIWPITFVVTGNDLAEMQGRIDQHLATIGGFLQAGGFTDDEISHSVPEITDKLAQGYAEAQPPKFRYHARVTVSLRTGHVDQARALMQQTGELVKQGITLSPDYGRQTEFLFTGLNDIKPDMIAEATRNARKAAEQFAADSGSQVGHIRQATQGIFSIADRDRYSPEFKKVRVVTHVQYRLSGK